MRNKKTPGISDTTETNPRAAKGIRSRSAIGVINVPTTKQATSAPVSTLPPHNEITAQRPACASAPIRIGMGNMRHGIEKNVP